MNFLKILRGLFEQTFNFTPRFVKEQQSFSIIVSKTQRKIY
jgi:hypothetical protein